MDLPEFKPAWWLPTAHLQTLWPAIVRRKPRLKVTRERVELADGDFIDLDWCKDTDDPLVMIMHGLEGSINSHYALALMASLKQVGFSAVFMHFRGCSGEANRLPRAYHSGDTDDMHAVVEYITRAHKRDVFAAIGISLGGNALLKWLGQSGKENPLQCALAVSVPFVLSDAADRLSSGFSHLYEMHLMRSLRKSYLTKFSQIESPLDIDVTEFRGFRDFDDQVTAPLHGFRDVDHYYTESSSRQYLKDITIPTCIIHSRDDPFMFPSSVPAPDELSEAVNLVLTEEGGHVGFVSGRFPWRPNYWYEEAVCTFLTHQLETSTE